jgi:hypothetical protein
MFRERFHGATIFGNKTQSLPRCKSERDFLKEISERALGLITGSDRLLRSHPVNVRLDSPENTKENFGSFRRRPDTRYQRMGGRFHALIFVWLELLKNSLFRSVGFVRPIPLHESRLFFLGGVSKTRPVQLAKPG